MLGVGGLAPWPMAQGASQSVSSVLTLTSTATVIVEFAVSGSSSLTLSDIAYHTFEEAASSTLVLVGTESEILSHGCWDTLTLTPTVTGILVAVRTVTSSLTLTSTASVIVIRQLFQVITFTQSAGIDILASASSSIALVSSVDVVHPESLADVIVISDSVTAVGSVTASSAVTLVSTVALLQILVRSCSSAIGLTAGALGYGAGVSECDEPNNDNIGIRDHITLSCDAPALSLDMRNPRFGNTYTTDTQVINRRTRGGQLSMGRSASWTVIRSYKMSFEALSEDDRDAFLDFVEQTAGLQIGILDHENREWSGILLTPEFVTTQDGPGCKFSLEFEFRGNPV